MRIGELSKRTEIATSRIRFYEKHGLIPKAVRGENGYRDYPEAAVKILRVIDVAQGLGFSLTEIREGLSDAAPHFPSRAAMIRALRSKHANVDQHLSEVQARRAQILKFLEEFEAEGPEVERPRG